MSILISLVTGTYNRLEYLSRMIRSFRNCLPPGITYEIIVVDAGSTDGTIEWCQKQAHLTLIQQGDRLGAIKAFDAGAEAASGEYVLLANDDIVFTPNSILPAIVHLETHADCGAVAFADNRPAPGYGEGFKVQTITAMLRDKQVGVPYPQVGLVRKFVGDAAGWWGSRDKAFNGHTYGGDSYLGARIWELGYSVEPVDGCRIIDLVAQDGLREANHQAEQRNPGAYYKRFPDPPQIRLTPQIEDQHDEQLRVLYLPLYEAHFGHYKSGLRQALSKCGLVYEIDYVNQHYDLVKAVETWKPHLLLMQVHQANAVPVQQLAAARATAPGMVVINWNGDVWPAGLTSPEMLAYLRHVDIALTVNARVIPTFEAAGIRAAYWQVAYEPVDEASLPDVPAHDVVFLANAYSKERQALGQLLQNMQGVNVGLYGSGWHWGNGNTVYNFAAGRAIYQKTKIAIGDNQYPTEYGFVSNRIFEALASGVFLLHQQVDGLETFTGLRDGVHYVSWRTTDELAKLVQYWLQSKRAAEREQNRPIRTAACARNALVR
jgi:glycosyltransferase involved in cell wall biosynthesis